MKNKIKTNIYKLLFSVMLILGIVISIQKVTAVENTITKITINDVDRNTNVNVYKIIDGKYVKDAENKWVAASPQYQWVSSLEGFFSNNANSTYKSNYYEDGKVKDAFNSNIATETLKEFYGKLSAYVGDEANSVTKTTITVSEAFEDNATTGSISFDLDMTSNGTGFGQYLILLSANDSIYQPVVINLEPNTNGTIDATKTIANPKKETLPVEKVLTPSTVNNSEYAKYTVSGNIPKYPDSATYMDYSLNDTMDEKMKLVIDTNHPFEAKLIKRSDVQNVTDYIVTRNDSNVGFVKTYKANAGENSFEISLDMKKFSNHSKYEKLQISYWVKISPDENGNVNDSYNNNVSRKMSVYPYESSSYGSSSVDTPVHYYGINFTKKLINSSGSENVNGIKFKIYGEGSSSPLRFKKYNDHYLLTSDAVNSTSTPNVVDSIELIGNGTSETVNLRGLPLDTYKIREIKAPSGYTIAAEKQVTLVDANSDGKIDGEETNIKSVEIDNIKAFNLPVTGDKGAFIIIIMGILLIGSGLYIKFYQKKKG